MHSSFEACIFLIYSVLLVDDISYLWERDDRRLIFKMLADKLLHPNHAVPAVAEMRVEFRAVFRQIFVLNFRIGYAGVHVEKALLAQHGSERVVQLSAKPTAARILIEIDRCLNRPIIRRARMKRTRIGIAEDIALPFEHEIRVSPERRFDSPAELLLARHIVFVCYRGVFDIGRVYF